MISVDTAFLIVNLLKLKPNISIDGIKMVNYLKKNKQKYEKRRFRTYYRVA